MMHASFFFIDIVGLSNPLLSTVTQAFKIKVLNDCLAQCKTYETTPKKEKIVFPTGDGMWISFLAGLEKPIKLAIELQEMLKNYNDDNSQNENIKVRIGCHSGDVFFVNDLEGTENLWGPGIIMAKRVMDAGDSGHILMTSTMADSLVELSDDYRKIIHPIHDFKIKHGEVLLVYSVYNDSFGNPNRPQTGIIPSKLEKRISEEPSPIWYQDLKLIVNLKNPQTNHFKISRTFCFENKSDEPIYEVYDIIETSVKKSFADLNVKAYDENENSLELGGIHVDTEYKKEFILKLNKPVFREDKNKEFTIIYETELANKFFEEFYQINIDNLLVKFIFPANSDISNPKLYLLSHQDSQKSLQEGIDVKRGVTTQITWNNIKEIKEKYLLRLEW